MVRKLDGEREGPTRGHGRTAPSRLFLSEEISDAAPGSSRTCAIGGGSPVLEYTKRLGGVRPEPIRVPQEEIEPGARVPVVGDLEESFKVAIENVRSFHKREMGPFLGEEPRRGYRWGRGYGPCRAGRYLRPRGARSLPSKVSCPPSPLRWPGVREILVCTPPRPQTDGRTDMGPRRRRASGARGSVRRRRDTGDGTLATGTETIAAVDKIVGPGNDYVTAAKLGGVRVVGIEAPQGPSDVVVIADRAPSPSESPAT